MWRTDGGNWIGHRYRLCVGLRLFSGVWETWFLGRGRFNRRGDEPISADYDYYYVKSAHLRILDWVPKQRPLI